MPKNVTSIKGGAGSGAGVGGATVIIPEEEDELATPEEATGGAAGTNTGGTGGAAGGAAVGAAGTQPTNTVQLTGVGATLVDQNDKDIIGDTGAGTVDNQGMDQSGAGQTIVGNQAVDKGSNIVEQAGTKNLFTHVMNQNDKDLIGDTGVGDVYYEGLDETGVGQGLIDEVAADKGSDIIEQTSVGDPIDIVEVEDVLASGVGAGLADQNDKDIIGDTGAGVVDLQGLDETGVGEGLVEDAAVDKGSDIVEQAGDQEVADEVEAEIAAEEAAAAEAAAAEEQAARDAEYDEEWADTWQMYEDSLDDQLAGTYADEARAQRTAANMGAQFGSGVGGAFGAASAQAALGGMQQRQQATAQWQQRGLEMKMGHLEKLMQRAEAANDRELQERLQDEMNQAMYDIKLVEAKFGADPYTLQYLETGEFPDEWDQA